jgi:hypothetical protein
VIAETAPLVTVAVAVAFVVAPPPEMVMVGAVVQPIPPAVMATALTDVEYDVVNVEPVPVTAVEPLVTVTDPAEVRVVTGATTLPEMFVIGPALLG